VFARLNQGRWCWGSLKIERTRSHNESAGRLEANGCSTYRDGGPPPSEIVVPATEKAEGFSVIVWPATTIVLSIGVTEVGVERENVMLPIAKAPDWSKLIIVSSTVWAGPPIQSLDRSGYKRGVYLDS